MVKMKELLHGVHPVLDFKGNSQMKSPQFRTRSRPSAIPVLLIRIFTFLRKSGGIEAWELADGLVAVEWKTFRGFSRISQDPRKNRVYADFWENCPKDPWSENAEDVPVAVSDKHSSVSFILTPSICCRPCAATQRCIWHEYIQLVIVWTPLTMIHRTCKARSETRLGLSFSQAC